MGIDLDKIDLDKIKEIDDEYIISIGKEMERTHFEYIGFMKRHINILKAFSTAFSILVIFNFYTIIDKIKKDDMTSVAFYLCLIIFNTFMATNSFSRIKSEILTMKLEKIDYDNLMKQIKYFKNERGNENGNLY